jgi:hypothetical protein
MERLLEADELASNSAADQDSPMTLPYCSKFLVEITFVERPPKAGECFFG